jgi:crotonobetainyl-CoA:carnitine CoA-transferase CaiB-like acyl-CoA transferase
MTATPLAGLKVLEFTHTVMGPTAGLILAELGADVIKVEPAPKGDHTRGLGGFGAGFFAAFNRNKRSLAVDLKQEDGRAVIHRLAATTDVVLENYGPGTMERLGVGWEQLSPLNPRLIYLALKGYLAGPYEHRPALDEVVQFQTGLAFMTGPPGRPLRAGASVIDIMGAMFGVIAVQAALRERDATGRGRSADAGMPRLLPISWKIFKRTRCAAILSRRGRLRAGHPWSGLCRCQSARHRDARLSDLR